MENNEDKRQMTVIAEKIHLIREDIKIDKIRKRTVEDFRMKEIIQKTIDNKSYAIIVLESLLPKERENLMSAYIDGTGYVINGGVPKKAWFRNKYKPYEK